MNRPYLLLIGAGGHAHACIDAIEQHDEYRIAGLIGTPEELNTRRLGYAVIGTDMDLPRLVREYQYAFISVGQIQSPHNRIRLYQRVLELGFELPVITVPTAYVSRHARIGAGTLVMHGAIVNAGAKVGKNCIINSRALIEHDSMVDDHCHVATGAILNGAVQLGAGSFIGSGSVIKEGVMLGQMCIVGMGLCVRHDQLDYARVTGRD